MKKNGVLQLSLQFNFRAVKDTCNSLYLYIVSANGQVAIHHIYDATCCNSIATKSKQLIFNYYSTPLYLHPWCHVDIINCHPSIKIWQVTLWRFLDIIIFFWNIDLHCPLWLLLMVWDCDMWHNKKCNMGCKHSKKNHGNQGQSPYQGLHFTRVLYVLVY